MSALVVIPFKRDKEREMITYSMKKPTKDSFLMIKMKIEYYPKHFLLYNALFNRKAINELILTFSISYKMAEIHPYFTTFLSVALLCLSKSISSGQISTHFRLKTKSRDEFNIKNNKT